MGFGPKIPFNATIKARNRAKIRTRHRATIKTKHRAKIKIRHRTTIKKSGSTLRTGGRRAKRATCAIFDQLLLYNARKAHNSEPTRP